MQSRLFRRETSRHLRAVSAQIADEYCTRRYRWMSAFRDPDCGALEALVSVLADSVERGDMAGYAAYTTAEEQTLLDSGLAPILVLAAAEVFERAVACFVTSDQRNLLERFFQAARESRQIILSEWIDRVEAAGA